MSRTRLAPLAVLLLTCLAGCGPSDPAADAQLKPGLVVTTVTPVNREVERALVVSGSVAAWQEMSLGVELTGIRIAEVLVEVGDRVRKGQALLRLDRRTLDVKARQAEASVAQAKASLALARANAARGETLKLQGLISASNADELRAKLAEAEAAVATADADRDAARLQLAFATLTAPDAGVISARNVQPGQIVSAGSELLRLIRQGRLEWRAQLPERDLARATPGTLVRVTSPDGDVIEGRVRAVSPAVDTQSRNGLVYADLPAPGKLRAGMFAEGRLLLGKAAAIVVPREAIVFRDGFSYVFVTSPAPGAGADRSLVKVSQRRIGVGTQQGDLVEVTADLSLKDRIVRRGAGFLGDGDIVRDAGATAAAGAEPTG